MIGLVVGLLVLIALTGAVTGFVQAQERALRAPVEDAHKVQRRLPSGTLVCTCGTLRSTADRFQDHIEEEVKVSALMRRKR